MDTEKAVKVYVKLRDARSDLRRKYEAQDADLRAKQDLIGAMLLDTLNKSGQRSATTDEGTYYKSEVVRPMGSDWDAFHRWVKENDAFDALERRIKTKFVTDYMDENDGALPPGVSVHREFQVRVRRGN